MTTPNIPPRIAGLLAPVFSLRHEQDLGIGDVASLHQLIDWAANTGIGFLQLLPINETGRDNSPYNAISSVALDPLTLDLRPNKIPALNTSTYKKIVGDKAPELRASRLINYPAVRKLKHALLRAAFTRFTSGHANPQEAAAFQSFEHAEKSWLEPYARFRYLMELAGNTEAWDQWPEAFNHPDKAIPYLEERHHKYPHQVDNGLAFHRWVQWVAWRQWQLVRAHADKCDVKLMGDAPIGVSLYSADVFAHPELFDLNWYGGAPPERIFKDDPFVIKWGQNWGIPLYNWEKMAEDDFQWWRQRIHKLVSIFRLYRIDHAIGIYRIYRFPWPPKDNEAFLHLSEDEAAAQTGGRLPGFSPFPDDTPEHQAANLACGDRRLRLLLDAGGDAELIAEDLGVVPEYVRPHLLELGIPGFKIPIWETGPDGHAIPGGHYPECSFATYATHDHQPLHMFWQEQRNLQHEGSDEEKHSAAQDLKALASFAGWPPHDQYPQWQEEIKWSMFDALLNSRSRYAALMITELFDLPLRFNIPGTILTENWSVRLPLTVAQFDTDPHYTQQSQTLAEIINITSRSPSEA